MKHRRPDTALTEMQTIESEKNAILIVIEIYQFGMQTEIVAALPAALLLDEGMKQPQNIGMSWFPGMAKNQTLLIVQNQPVAILLLRAILNQPSVNLRQLPNKQTKDQILVNIQCHLPLQAPLLSLAFHLQKALRICLIVPLQN